MNNNNTTDFEKLFHDDSKNYGRNWDRAMWLMEYASIILDIRRWRLAG